MAYIERRSLEFPLIVVKQDDQVKSFSLSLNSRFIVFFFFLNKLLLCRSNLVQVVYDWNI